MIGHFSNISLETSQVAMMRKKQKCMCPLSFYLHLHEKDSYTHKQYN